MLLILCALLPHRSQFYYRWKVDGTKALNEWLFENWSIYFGEMGICVHDRVKQTDRFFGGSFFLLKTGYNGSVAYSFYPTQSSPVLLSPEGSSTTRFQTTPPPFTTLPCTLFHTVCQLGRRGFLRFQQFPFILFSIVYSGALGLHCLAILLPITLLVEKSCFQCFFYFIFEGNSSPRFFTLYGHLLRKCLCASTVHQTNARWLLIAL